MGVQLWLEKVVIEEEIVVLFLESKGDYVQDLTMEVTDSTEAGSVTGRVRVGVWLRTWSNSWSSIGRRL